MTYRAFRLCSLVIAGLLLAGQPVPAQRQTAQPETKSGTLKEVVTKGRSKTLVITTDDGDVEVRVTPTLSFAVTAPGDKDFILPENFLTGTGVLTQDRIFLSDVTVHLAAPGVRFPPGRVAKPDKLESGQSENTYLVSGLIQATGPAQGYEDYTAVSLKVAGRVPEIWLDKGVRVTVSSSDPDHAAPGSAVTLYQRPLRGDRFLTTGVKVTRTEPFEKPGSGDGDAARDDEDK